MMTSRHDSSPLYSAFLSLPTEIRCEIYDYLLVDSQSITISAGYITVFGNRINDRARKLDIPGLPLNLAPLVRRTRDASLLSVANPPEIAIDNALMDDVARKDSAIGMPALVALSLSCRLVNDELADYLRKTRQIKIARARAADPTAEEYEPTSKDEDEGLSLYVTYPYGILVLKSLYPYLLKQARRVYISGYYRHSAESKPKSSKSADRSSDERLTPSNSFTAAEPSGRSFSQRSMVRTTRRRSPDASSTRPRLRLDRPLTEEERRLSKIELAFPSFADDAYALAPAALTHLVRTLFSPTPSHCVKLSARFLYPGESSYGNVWSPGQSPVVQVLNSVCGGKINLNIKRGGLGTGVALTVRARPKSRIVSTGWAMWITQMDVDDLDTYLVAEDHSH